MRAALGVVTALVLVGGGLAVWKGMQGSKKPVPTPVTEVGTPAPLSVPEAPSQVAAAQEVKASPDIAPPPLDDAMVPTPKPGRERTRRDTRRQPAPAAPTPPVTAKAPEPAPAPEEVLTGEGALRIRAVEGISAEVKLPGRGREPLPAAIRSMAAGTHTAEFFLKGGGTARCIVKVRPDRRTAVTFDGKNCSVEYM